MIATQSKGNKSNSQLVPAVAYVRCSSDAQVDASIPAQKASIEKFASDNGYRVIRWYVDEGISGWKDTREEFQRLITDLPRGDFSAVLCWDQNRFSRFPVLEANHYWFLLDRAGVHLATCNQGRVDWHSIAGWLTASIKQHADSQHRYQLSADVKRGKRRIAERGEWQGRVPYGYARGDDHKLAVSNPAEAAVIRRIFDEYQRGESLRGIAHLLNVDGIDARDGRGWTANSVRDKLTNPAYVGDFKWQELFVRSHHAAIIGRDTFENVQRLLSERQTSTTPKASGGGFLLTGVLKCGKCGSPMHGQRSSRGHEYYGCQRHKSKGTLFCDRNSVRQSEIVEHIVTALESWLTNPKTIQRLRAELHKQTASTATKANPERLRKQLDTLAAKLTKAKQRLLECDSDILADVQQGIRDLRAEQGRLQTALEAASTPLDAITAEQDERIDAAVALFSTLRQTLSQADPVLFRELLRETIDHVDVVAERVGKGHYHIERGVVVVRSDNLFGSSD